MAELNVEPKKSSPIWWIILIIIVVLIILYFVFRSSNNTNGIMNTGKDSTGMMRINGNQNNTVAMYQWRQLNEPAQYS